ncbi:hypothetical protein [Sphingobacterium multivorum]|uniref:hypothetical protein n=1 Tax=Sphingobacterium multivorum TaxID=28454 RepID=UPI0031B9D3F1
MDKLQQLLPTNEVMSVAQLFAESGMFTDAKQASQAFVKIMAGQELGIPPFAAMSGVHIIQGKPTIGAGLIASTVKGSGKYDYRVIEQSEKICSIDFYQGNEKIGNSTFTIDDAKKAQTKNLDKFPKNMLFARAISNGVKWYCPDVFSGPVYTPEEMNIVDIPHIDVKEPVLETSEAVNEALEIDQAIIDSFEACSTPEEVREIYKSIPKGAQNLYKDLATDLGKKLKGAA